MKINLLTLYKLGDVALLLEAIDPRPNCDANFLSRFLSNIGKNTIEHLYYLHEGYVWILTASNNKFDVSRLAPLDVTYGHPVAWFYSYLGKHQTKSEYWLNSNEK